MSSSSETHSKPHIVKKIHTHRKTHTRVCVCTYVYMQSLFLTYSLHIREALPYLPCFISTKMHVFSYFHIFEFGMDLKIS